MEEAREKVKGGKEWDEKKRGSSQRHIITYTFSVEKNIVSKKGNRVLKRNPGRNLNATLHIYMKLKKKTERRIGYMKGRKAGERQGELESKKGS